MTFYIPNVDPVYIFKRNSNEFIPLAETIKIKETMARLKEIPDFNTKVKVKDGTTVLTEVFNKNDLLANEFRVDYTVGLVFFHASMNEKTLSFEYLGMGSLDFSANRIHFSNGDTLQQLVNTMDTIKTNWLPAVSTFADISTKYPTPKQGDTVQIANGKVYRYENGQWINNLTISDTAITDLQNRILELESHIDAGSFTDDIDDGVLDGGVF